MTLKTILFAAAFVLPATLVLAQNAAPPPDLKTYMSSPDIQAMIAKAKAMPPKPLISQPIVGTGAYQASLEYRSGLANPASIHDAENELMVVVDGTGTITIGGT